MNEQLAPDVTELYTVAIHTSNLRVEADKASPADILIAAAWSPSRLGSALLRLASTHKNLAEVHGQLEITANLWGCVNPGNVAASVLSWWLKNKCSTCNGTKFEVIEGTGRQSGRVCKTCAGTGESPLPCGEAGRSLAMHIDYSLQCARTSIKTRLCRTK